MRLIPTLIGPVVFFFSAYAHGQAVIDPLVNWPTWYGVQQTGTINTTFDCFGSIGYCNSTLIWDVPEWPRVNFEAPAGSGIEYLYFGTMWIGGIIGDDTLVTEGYGEIRPPSKARGSVTWIPGPGDFRMRAVAHDTIQSGIRYRLDYCRSPASYLPMNIRYVVRSYVWRDQRTADIVLYDLLVTNTGEDLIQSGFVGLLTDADIGKSSYAWDDLAGSIPEHSIAYAIDNDGDPDYIWLPDTLSPRRALGMRFLRASFDQAITNFNWWSLHYFMFAPRMRGTAEYPFRDFVSQVYDNTAPYCDRDKYYVMSKPEWDYDQYRTKLISPDDPDWLYPDPSFSADVSDGKDISMLLSTGPFDLPPDSSVRAIFAMFAPDSVIYRPDLQVLYHLFPEYFAQFLDLDKLTETAGVADSLAELLLNPLNPVVGLQVSHNDPDSIVFEWDPWVFPGLDGYELYYTAVEPEVLPHPGVLPPWYRPAQLNYIATTGFEPRFTITEPDPTRFYCFNAAQLSSHGVGDSGEPVFVHPGGHQDGPGPLQKYAFAVGTEPLEFRWTEPGNQDVSYYRIYKFPDAESARHRYHAFYDLGFAQDSISPVEQFERNGLTYYYYEMQAYDSVFAPYTQYEDFQFDQEAVYVIAAVDSYGFKSEFSAPVYAERISEKTKDLLVITYSSSTENFVELDTIRSFYEYVLAGYLFDFYVLADTFAVANCPAASIECMDWLDLTRYKMVIVDDGLLDGPALSLWELHAEGFTKYLLSGGRLAYFGSLSSFLNLNMDTPAGWYQPEGEFVSDFFALDSVFYCGLGHFLINCTPPFVDTSFAFNLAEGADPMAPDVRTANPADLFTADLNLYWPDSSLPLVSVFAPGDGAAVTHLARTDLPETSWLEGSLIGLHTMRDEFETYLFGFHLWYMNRSEARDLIDWLEVTDSLLACCPDMTGNIDVDPDGTIDIHDLTLLIDHLFISLAPLRCPEAANVNGDDDGLVDVADLTCLIDYLFITNTRPADCR
ncbi:MAG: hypothetical protein JSU65_06595 [Candidatus Zixiibacteriota bacterium]|nr:MAG: hypothetical protein JSU65_06595 [candidate division Zixibacteria bacterium]